MNSTAPKYRGWRTVEKTTSSCSGKGLNTALDQDSMTACLQHRVFCFIFFCLVLFSLLTCLHYLSFFLSTFFFLSFLFFYILLCPFSLFFFFLPFFSCIFLNFFSPLSSFFSIFWSGHGLNTEHRLVQDSLAIENVIVTRLIKCIRVHVWTCLQNPVWKHSSYYYHY